MMNLRVTLYDVFGYLLPGTVFLASMLVLFWAMCIPQVPLQLITFPIEAWALFFLLAYFCGHAAQALGNILESLLSKLVRRCMILDKILSVDKNALVNGLGEAVKVAAKTSVASLTKINADQITPELLYYLCDEAVAQGGATENCEIFEYREGFYRGMTVSWFLLSISLLIRVFRSDVAVILASGPEPIEGRIFFFVIIASLLTAALFFMRYHLFARHRVEAAIYGFLMLRESKTPQKDG